MRISDWSSDVCSSDLLEMAEAIAGNAGAGLIYSDEDKIDAEGRRFDPYFKPDWDPDLLRSQNYVCHFMAIRTDLVCDVGGFRSGFDGSQDNDLVLCCPEKFELAQMVHISAWSGNSWHSNHK